MSTPIEEYSTLTDRYQTTIPASIRQALKLKRRDRIHYALRSNGEVVLSRAIDEAKHDPVLVNFLNFLERDLLVHPESIRPVTAGSFVEVECLIAGIEVDLEEVLEENDDE
ncbi:type II toxin-antitoxin system PrlF family antitoxin [Vreelandella neptunia]|uniref:Type II toxin-antitoxin system PrlF family antitoxin n=1 Tax=Vreelandella neptunia TaxID=115551 RepID=A0ABZ0YKD8_9GAMM|nr:type II toxin-antitoxin system PrlF family antitoxin [Halomonas neptunia]MDN3561345.1 type II toxin-antitoxin system PrlF family antitoxin [Halomonas neptunia]WQH12580.1 type II toxin-antitoxin system PrlF family antitoxin [Halomonas neptunia]